MLSVEWVMGGLMLLERESRKLDQCLSLSLIIKWQNQGMC